MDADKTQMDADKTMIFIGVNPRLFAA